MTRIQELATLISTNTEKINQHLISTNQPTPSFDAGSPDLDLPHDVQALRELVIEASSELQELLMGPKELLMSNSVSPAPISLTLPLKISFKLGSLILFGKRLAHSLTLAPRHLPLPNRRNVSCRSRDDLSRDFEPVWIE
jgi:hypothetical protein